MAFAIFLVPSVEPASTTISSPTPEARNDLRHCSIEAIEFKVQTTAETSLGLVIEPAIAQVTMLAGQYQLPENATFQGCQVSFLARGQDLE